MLETPAEPGLKYLASGLLRIGKRADENPVDERKHRSGAHAARPLVNRTSLRRFLLADLWRLDDWTDYHDLLFESSVGSYLERAKREGFAPGSVLAVGAGWREAETLVRFPFDEIVLSGVVEPDERVQRALEADRRLRYELANGEALRIASRSFDLVLCKEALHHLARPLQGLYEMLRVARRAVAFVEPWDCALGRCLERVGLATRYEGDQAGNSGQRDNHVFRFDRHLLEGLLRSLYLESGAVLELRVGWLSSRAFAHRRRAVRRLSALVSAAASRLPGARGNLVCALVVPGADLPPDPRP